MSSCSCLTFLPYPARVLLSKICTLFSRSLYMLERQRFAFDVLLTLCEPGQLLLIWGRRRDSFSSRNVVSKLKELRTLWSWIVKNEPIAIGSILIGYFKSSPVFRQDFGNILMTPCKSIRKWEHGRSTWLLPSPYLLRSTSLNLPVRIEEREQSVVA